MHYRFYGSNMGRFMKPDNINGNMGDPQSWNLYSYVQENPVNFNDPTGHMYEYSMPMSPRRLGWDDHGEGTPSGDPEGQEQAQDLNAQTGAETKGSRSIYLTY